MTWRSAVIFQSAKLGIVLWLKGREIDATWVTCLFCYAWRDCNYTTLQAKGGTETMRLSSPCRKRSIAEAHTTVAVTGCLRTCTFETQFEDLLRHNGESLLVWWFFVSMSNWPRGNCFCRFEWDVFFKTLYLVLTSNDYILIPQIHRQV